MTLVSHGVLDAIFNTLLTAILPPRISIALKVTDLHVTYDRVAQIQSHYGAVIHARAASAEDLTRLAYTSLTPCQDATSGPEGAITAHHEAGLCVLWSQL